MRILVVGASGFLGRNVIREAAAQQCETMGTYSKSKDFPAFARRYRCKAIQYDLLGPRRQWDADVCIYLAGNSSHVASVESPLDDLRRNTEGLNRFLESFRGPLVYLSSAAVYEGHTGLVGPATCLHPRLPYAISKMACERYIVHYADRGDLPWATVLRLYYAYGPYDRDTRLIPRLVRASRSREQSFTVTSPRGSLIDPLYSRDVARAVLAAARGKAKTETLDLCGGRPKSVTAFVREVTGLDGWRPKFTRAPRRGEAPLRFRSDASPARRKLALERLTPLDQGLRDYTQWRVSLEA